MLRYSFRNLRQDKRRFNQNRGKSISNIKINTSSGNKIAITISSSPKPTTTTPTKIQHQHAPQKHHQQHYKTHDHQTSTPWILVELRHGAFFRFPIPQDLFRFSERRGKLIKNLSQHYRQKKNPGYFWRNDALKNPDFFVPLHLGDLVLCRVGNVYQTGLVHGGSLLPGRFFLPFSFHHQAITLLHKQGLREVSALVFPRTGGEIVGLLRKSDLVAYQSRALVTPPPLFASLSEQQEDPHDLLTEEHEEKLVRSIVGEGVPRLKLPSTVPASQLDDLKKRICITTDDTDTNHNDNQNSSVLLSDVDQQLRFNSQVYDTLKRQYQFETKLIEVCRQELEKREIRSVEIVSATSNVNQNSAYFFYRESDTSTPLADFKEHIASVLKLETVWFTNIGNQNLFDEMQLKVLNRERERDDRNRYIWPNHLDWPTPSRHLIRKSTSSSSIAIVHLLRCCLMQPKRFNLLDRDKIEMTIWQQAIVLLLQTSKNQVIAATKAASFSLALVLCALCGKLDEKESGSIFLNSSLPFPGRQQQQRQQQQQQVGHSTHHHHHFITPRDAISILLLLGPTQKAWFLDHCLCFASSSSSSSLSLSQSIVTSASSSSRIKVDPKEAFDFLVNDIQNDIASEYTSIHQRGHDLDDFHQEEDSGENNNNNHSRSNYSFLEAAQIPKNRFHQLASTVGLWKNSDVREDYSKIVDFMNDWKLGQENEVKLKTNEKIEADHHEKESRKQISLDNNNNNVLNKNSSNNDDSHQSNRNEIVTIDRKDENKNQKHNNRHRHREVPHQVAINQLSQQRQREGLIVFGNLNRVIRQPYMVKYKGDEKHSLMRPKSRTTEHGKEEENIKEKTVAGTIEAAILRKSVEEQTLMKRAIFEVALEMTSRVIVDECSSSVSNIVNLDPQQVKDIRTCYIANYHRELPPSSLAHWATLVRVANTKRSNNNSAARSPEHHSSSSSKSGQPEKVSSSTSTWKSAIQVLMKNIRQCDRHDNNNISKENNSPQKQKQFLIQSADSILEVCADNQKQSVQRMRMVLNKLRQQRKEEEEDSNNSHQNHIIIRDDSLNNAFPILNDTVSNEEELEESVEISQKRMKIALVKMMYRGYEFK